MRVSKAENVNQVGERYFRVKNNDKNAREGAEEPEVCIYVVRLVDSFEMFQMLTFTDVSQVYQHAQKKAERKCQMNLLDPLNGELNVPLDSIIKLSKLVENKIASMSHTDSFLPEYSHEESPADKSDNRMTRMTFTEAKKMQHFVASVWTSGQIMLYYKNSRLSHFRAQSGTLSTRFKKIESHAVLLKMIAEFLFTFQFAINEQNIHVNVQVNDDMPQSIFIDSQRYLEILFQLIA